MGMVREKPAQCHAAICAGSAASNSRYHADRLPACVWRVVVRGLCESVSEDDYDGCGVRPLATGTDDPFYPACQWHDAAYTNLSWAERNVERKIVDLQFYRQMLQIAGTNTWLRWKAWLYYRIARLFGARFWEKH